MEGLCNFCEAIMKLPPTLLQLQAGCNSPTPHPQRLLSRDEVTSIYGIPKRFLELAAGTEDGPIFVKIGRLTRYRVQDVEDWISKNRYASIRHAAAQKDGL
jgi:hypothetical protein